VRLGEKKKANRHDIALLSFADTASKPFGKIDSHFKCSKFVGLGALKNGLKSFFDSSSFF
jgi:hypothetical protein